MKDNYVKFILFLYVNVVSRPIERLAALLNRKTEAGLHSINHNLLKINR